MKKDIFDIIDHIIYYIKHIRDEIGFRFQSREKAIITLTREPQKYCPVNKTHIWREAPWIAADTFYCAQCLKHYSRNEMIE